MKLAVQAVLLATSWALYYRDVAARQAFEALIPNANGPFGHANGVPGGPLNAFGQAFQAANFQWTPALCQQDSDGDGATNGEELGDPCCQWVPGSALPLATASVTHPGEADAFTEAQLASMRCVEAQEAPTDAPMDAWMSLEPVVDSTSSVDMEASGTGSGSGDGDGSWPDVGASIRPKTSKPSKEPVNINPPAKSLAASRYPSVLKVLSVGLAGVLVLA